MYCGNTNLLQVMDGYMTIAHRYFHGDRGKRTYANYLIRYDRNLKPMKISTPFKLCEEGIEFVTWWKRDHDDILIGVTEMDDKPMMLRFDYREFIEGVNML